MRRFLLAARMRVTKTQDSTDLDAMVDAFAGIIKQKLVASERKRGWNGQWKIASTQNIDGLRQSLYEHVMKGDPVDVAALAGMLWFHGASTIPVSQCGFDEPPDDSDPFSKAWHEGVKWTLESLGATLGVDEWDIGVGGDTHAENILLEIRNILRSAGFTENGTSILTAKRVIELLERRRQADTNAVTLRRCAVAVDPDRETPVADVARRVEEVVGSLRRQLAAAQSELKTGDADVDALRVEVMRLRGIIETAIGECDNELVVCSRCGTEESVADHELDLIEKMRSELDGKPDVTT